jgi:hypothetical protein
LWVAFPDWGHRGRAQKEWTIDYSAPCTTRSEEKRRETECQKGKKTTTVMLL